MIRVKFTKSGPRHLGPRRVEDVIAGATYEIEEHEISRHGNVCIILDKEEPSQWPADRVAAVEARRLANFAAIEAKHAADAAQERLDEAIALEKIADDAESAVRALDERIDEEPEPDGDPEEGGESEEDAGGESPEDGGTSDEDAGGAADNSAPEPDAPEAPKPKKNGKGKGGKKG